MSEPNSHGLSRDIPEAIKREVRQKCGFGCVICGASIVDYEHILPTFADSKVHSADCIALLCPMHHALVTRKHLSKETVQEALAKPKSLQKGFSFGDWDPAKKHPIINFAGCHLYNCIYPIVLEGEPLITIEEPENEDGPYRLSGKFFNEEGQLSLEIIRNEWRAYVSGWDITNSGGRITIRLAQGKISFQILFLPRIGIVIERLDMKVGAVYLEGDTNTLKINNINKTTLSSIAVLTNKGVGIHIHKGGLISLG